MDSERIKPYEILRQAGFIKKNRASSRFIANAPIGMIIDTCEAISEMTLAKENTSYDGLFSHSASKALSGGGTPCSGYECRNKNINSMLQFAALYSDRVYSYNFLSDVNRKRSDNDIRDRFCDDVKLLCTIEPLVSSGNIQLTHFGTVCPHCTFEKYIRTTTQDKIDAVRSEFIKDYYKEVKFTLEYEAGFSGIKLNGPKSLLYPHGESFRRVDDDTMQELLDIAPGIVGKALRAGQANIPVRVAKDLCLGEEYAHGYMGGIAFELGAAGMHKTAYLSDNEYEIAAIRRLTADPIAQRCSVLLSKHLECILPFVKTRTPSDLLSIRNNEYDSFVTFRRSFEKAIAECVGAADELSERTAIMIYQDIVHPEISRLNAIVNNANASFENDFNRKITGWSLSLCAGILGGLLSYPVIASLGAFNVLKTGAELIFDYLKSKDGEATIKNDEYYFLWKLHKSLTK